MTVSVYDSYRVPWWEIGVFRDAITGEIPMHWTNPVTGVVNDHPVKFEEGPSGFSIRQQGDGVQMFDAVQAFAALESAEITFRDVGSRVVVTQVETKTRSFPGKDGIPDLDAGKGSRSSTVLQWMAERDDLESSAPSVHATGVYSLEIAAPAWLGFGDTPAKIHGQRADGKGSDAGTAQPARMARPATPVSALFRE